MQLRINYNHTMQILKYISVAAVTLLLLNGCNQKVNGDKFNRVEMLTNLSSHIIIPAHQQFSISSGELKQKKDAFISNPSSVTLDSLKSAFLLAYTSYMKVEAYSLPPSEGLRNLNVFTTDTAQIKSNVSSGSYDLNTANNIRAKGFPAIDFMLYSGSSNEILTRFTSDINASGRKQYLSDIVNEIETVSSNASSAWTSYVDQFIGASGTDIGSSSGMLVNDLSFEIERCRRERVGNSLGYLGSISTGTLNPMSVEAYYSAYSKELLIENLKECKTLYTGGTGISFDDYLAYLNADYNGQPLDSVITNQFDVTIQKAQNVPVDFSTAITTNKPEMESLFLELKKLTVLLKVDMSSQLGVIINYSDTDGD
ncbi:MAG: imelysin family protein [Bacteroidetes bacterium]|nr:imelysin family protein [Bacteroidota bacterium]